MSLHASPEMQPLANQVHFPRQGIVRFVHTATNIVICERAIVAGTFLKRLVGLLGRGALPPDEGLWIVPSAGVHTIGMRFPIDVVLLDAKLHVLEVHRGVPSRRFVGLFSRSASALELPAQSVGSAMLRRGDRLIIERTEIN